jgi:hypothetical protein
MAVVFDCPYAACVWPRCLKDQGAAVNYPLCASEDWTARQHVAKSLTVMPRAIDNQARIWSRANRKRRKDLEQL